MTKYNRNKEIWKDVKEWEGIYQVSNLGRVRSVERTTIYKNGRKRSFPSKILKLAIDSSGYYGVILKSSPRSRTVRVHRLVAENFLENTDVSLEVNHIDENKLNNNVYNLEWMSSKDNTNHGTGIRRRAMIRSKPITKSSLSDELIEVYPSLEAAASSNNFNKSNISNAANGKLEHAYGFKWKYIS